MSKLKLSTGFTLIELVMVIVILGIISVVAAPKFFDNSVFQARGFADQVLATLRYAQKSAIAQHQNVCVSFTATKVSLKIDATCSTNLNLPDRQNNELDAPSGISFSTIPSNFSFDALGKPSVGTSGVISTTTITVEQETGYVH